MSKTQEHKFADLIELIVNEDNKAAKKLFHDIVVEQSRTIYEGLIDDEDLKEMDDADDIEDMVDDVEADEKGLDEGNLSVSVAEAKQLLDYIDGTLNEADSSELLQRVAEHFDVAMEDLSTTLEGEGDELLDIAYGDEEDDMGGEEEFGGEESDFDADGEMDDHEMDHSEDDVEDDSQEDRIVDLEDGLDSLQAKFDELIGDEGMEFDDEGGDEFGADDMGGDEFGADDMGGEEDFGGEEDDVEEGIVREYVEKVTAAVTNDTEQESPNTKSIVAGKNDMGGTTANIAKGSPDEKGAGKVSVGSIDSRSFQNDPKAKAGKTSFKKKETAKKADAPENKKSLLDGPKGKGVKGKK